MVACRCVFLDGKEVEISIEKDATGSDLFTSVCKYLNLKFHDPFGIVFRGGAGPAPYNWWIRMDKTLKGQIPGKCKVWEFAFIVKYYPKTLAGMQEEVARFHVIMQIRQDLLTGRLRCPAQTMAHLCSYWLQAQYGDWSSRHIDLQLADAFRYVQKGEVEADKTEGKSDIVFEEQMMQIHQAHVGMSSRDADYKFIRLAASLPKYGIHYYPMWAPTQQKQSQSEERGEKMTVGIGPIGVHQFKRNGNETVWTWKSMRAVSFKHNRIVLKMQGSMRQSVAADAKQSEKAAANQRHIVKEYCLEDMYQTKIIWQALIQYHMFFRVADQQGLQGEQRKRLVSSLRIKRTIPMVGEKKALQSPISPLSKISPRSKSVFSFDLSRRKSSTKDPATAKRSSSQQPRPSSPLPISRKAQISKISSVENGLPEDTELEQDDVDEIFKPASLTNTRLRTAPPSTRQKTSLTSPASYASTPRSGQFLFPLTPTPRQAMSSVSQTSTSVEEVLGAHSDNTDVLCSPNILEKTFSYSEDHGVNNIGIWQEGLTPRGRSKTQKQYKAPRSRSTPVRRPNYEHTSSDYSRDGRFRSERVRRLDPSPVVIPAEVLLADLKETQNPETRSSDGYYSSLSDFPMELDFEAPKPRTLAFHTNNRKIDFYTKKLATRAMEAGPTDRRTRSMHALNTNYQTRERRAYRDQSTSPRRGRHTSIARRMTNQENVEPMRARGEKRGYSERAYSESRATHKQHTDQSLTGGAKKTPEVVRRMQQPSAKRRSTTRPRAHSEEKTKMIPPITPRKRLSYEGQSKRRPDEKSETIPKIPVFVRTVP
uniref:tyrosine-protein phosphatase non-receptor type 4-like n=1 Tax=Styela clava TaxID=7725 RepID=UPI001939AADD|nr:tyrosine-protein phosphatase non-receptor type 4-like [Styela clava]